VTLTEESTWPLCQMKEIVDKKSEGRSENGDMIVRGLLNTCHNAYLCVHRDGCRNDADGGSGSETDACNVGPPDVRRAPVSAPNSPGPALRRSRSPVAGYRTPETRSDERTSGVSMSTSQLFAQVDRLFDGSEADRELASTLLQANEHKVNYYINSASIGCPSEGANIVHNRKNLFFVDRVRCKYMVGLNQSL
jgi:hypothetical protein